MSRPADFNDRIPAFVAGNGLVPPGSLGWNCGWRVGGKAAFGSRRRTQVVPYPHDSAKNPMMPFLGPVVVLIPVAKG